MYTMGQTTLSFRTNEKKRDEIDKIAAQLDRDRSWVLNDAIDRYLELQRWHLERIDKGIRDAKEGRTFSTDQLRARFARRHAAEIKKTAKDKVAR
jgi:predicted transcriptional regulator